MVSLGRDKEIDKCEEIVVLVVIEEQRKLVKEQVDQRLGLARLPPLVDDHLAAAGDRPQDVRPVLLPPDERLEGGQEGVGVEAFEGDAGLRVPVHREGLQVKELVDPINGFRNKGLLPILVRRDSGKLLQRDAETEGPPIRVADVVLETDVDVLDGDLQVVHDLCHQLGCKGFGLCLIRIYIQ